eukprot:TRINITY_DN504_c0_g1_i2.p1 TRINITY_DN504_c0_g1~~TRINITY_DN504_c0_g1_i2.p1  ORF type:complete len:546 (+),score=171.97 TRINITY_DN504_c0_g1_i2:106-1743(+)
MNVSAGTGLQNVLKSNLGPRGTLKMLVGGAGDIKLTKDGNVLLHEMQIQHPTAALIARTATDQDNVTGDGTTSNVLIIGEILKQAERHLSDGIHPRSIVEGFEVAREQTLAILDQIKVKSENPADRELLLSVARTSLKTKVDDAVAKVLTEAVVDALLTIRKPGVPIDLFMVEILTMKHQSGTDTKLIKGIVMDHGARHPDMPKRLENAFILTCNVSFEYEKPETNTTFNYSNTTDRDQMVEMEHKWVDDRVRKVIELKRKVCDEEKGSTFVVLNQKGIDPMALDMFAKEGILALRRAKRRNMERLTLACGGVAVNSVEDITAEVLGRASLVYEQVLGEEKYTFVEGVNNPFSVSILIKGPNGHTINQIKDATRDGIRAVNNAIVDEHLVPGGGAFEIAAHLGLKKYADTADRRFKLGIDIFAESLLIIPKTLAENSGFDKQEAIGKLIEGHKAGVAVGLDLETCEPMDPGSLGVWDNYRVKRQIVYSSLMIATQLLLVDEIMKAGKSQNEPKAPSNRPVFQEMPSIKDDLKKAKHRVAMEEEYV